MSNEKVYNALERFMYDSIKRATDKSDAEGIQMYKNYFVNTKVYAKYRENVDELLIKNDYERVISFD